jgi:hypothetical protein
MAFSRKEAVLALQLQTFASGIFADPSRFGVATPDALSIKSAVDNFLALRVIANTPATRNVGSIDAKDAGKASALGICGVFYRQIQNSNGVSNDDKLLVGVMPFNTTRTPRTCPLTSPVVGIIAGTPLALTAEFRDSMDPSARGLPAGATMCQVFAHVGDENVETIDLKTARFIGNFTTNPMAVVFEGDDRGKQATLFGRWGGRRNQFGQWSLPVSMTIAA